jgi:predicted ATPase
VLAMCSALRHAIAVPQVLCPSLIGRQSELAEVVQLLDAPQGGAVFVLGEAGIGKSRLVRETTQKARQAGLRVLAGRAVPGQSPVPYRPLAEALSAACRRGGPPDAPELIPYRAALGRLIPEWHRPELAGSAESTVVLGEGVLRMLRVLDGGAGVLLIIEDLHWADPETVAVVEYLAEHSAEERIVCVGTCRPEPGPGLDLVREMSRHRTARLLELAPLSPAEVAEMARECLCTSVEPQDLDRLLARADGVPFLVEELLAAAIDSGGLVYEGDEWAVRPGAAAVVPRTYAETVAHHIDSLDPVDRRVPRAAALLGRRVDIALVALVVDRSRDDVLAVLDRCADLRLVSRETDSFQFRHALTRDAVLAELPAAVRIDLARRARRAVDAAHPTLPGPWCQLAAELDLASGEAEEAARLFATAGRRMIALGALPTASAVLERARGLVAGDSKLAVEIDELRTEVAALSGEVDAAFDVGTRLIETLADPARRAQAHLCLAEAASAATAWGRAKEQLACARAFADDEPTAVRIDALSAHVQLGMARSDLAEAGGTETPARRCLGSGSCTHR